MNQILPSNLSEVETIMSNLLIDSINEINSNKLSINLKFEGLRLMPPMLRLGDKLLNKKIQARLLWSDAGSVALAKRDAPFLTDYIHSFSEINTGKLIPDKNDLLICVSPQPYDYEDFFNVCNSHNGKIIMVNGRLEDFAVGIGSTGRDRRKVFISSWRYIYCLEPITNGALMKIYPYPWSLFRRDEDGYRFLKSFDEKPDQELIIDALLNY